MLIPPTLQKVYYQWSQYLENTCKEAKTSGSTWTVDAAEAKHIFHALLWRKFSASCKNH